MFSRRAAINSISGSHMNTQFRYTLAYRLYVSKIARRHLAKPNRDPSLRHFVTDTLKPIRKWLSSIFGSIADELDHASSVA